LHYKINEQVGYPRPLVTDIEIRYICFGLNNRMKTNVIGRAWRWLLWLTLATLPLGGGIGTGSQSLSAAVYPSGSITVPAAAVLTTSATKFQPFTGSITVNYRSRTTPVGGGNLTLSLTSDFAPLGGPSVAAGALAYTCSGSTLGSACSGAQTASTTLQTPVVTLPAAACTGGGGACSSQNPNSVNLTFILADDPGYATGTYSARITFTISST
jgi:hypothetical protein